MVCIKITRGLRSFFFLICFFLKKKTCRYGCSSEIKLIKSKECLGGGGEICDWIIKDLMPN